MTASPDALDRKMAARIDHLLASRAVAVARLRASYKSGAWAQATEPARANCRRNFRVLNGQLRIAVAELATRRAAQHARRQS